MARMTERRGDGEGTVYIRAALIGGELDGGEALATADGRPIGVEEGGRSGTYHPTGRTDGRGRAIYSNVPR